MKILVINADCITINTSANLCHLAYLKGLVDAGHQVDLLSAQKVGYPLDPGMVIPESVRHYQYNGLSFYEKLSVRKAFEHAAVKKTAGSDEGQSTKNLQTLINKNVHMLKDFVLGLYGVHGIYSTFVRKAMKFKSKTEYDYVLSLSTPTASHLLAYKLLQRGNIRARRWIQIWEDPWYSDAYGFNADNRFFKEESKLLSYAEKVCYVSPLTLKNQQKIYPEAAEKMYWQPLPYYYKENTVEGTGCSNKNVYGYFGAYFPSARDLKPFYKAALAEDIYVNICGDPSNLFESTPNIHIYPRLPLAQLKPIEDASNVLIFLCNRKGGQIPGKIYQYSATHKTILFIMDGTEEEKETLKSYFGRFKRYIFCENTEKDIVRAIRQIEKGDLGMVKNQPVDDFNPKETIRKVLLAE